MSLSPAQLAEHYKKSKGLVDKICHSALAPSAKPNPQWDTIHPAGENTKQLARDMFYYWLKEFPANPLATSEDHIQKFQHKAVIDEIYNILRRENSVLLAGTGTGKTYMLLGAVDIVIYFGFIEFAQVRLNRPVIPFPFLYLVNANAVNQIQEVISQFPNCKGKVFVINYEQLRTKISLASVMVKTLSVVKENKKPNPDPDIDTLREFICEDDVDYTIRSWDRSVMPIGIIKDEVQKLKNNGAQQTKTCQAYSVITQNNPECFIEFNASATPLVRLSESRTLCLSCKPPIGKNIQSPRCNLYKWPEFTNYICDGDLPEDYSPDAMERFRAHLDIHENIIHVTDVKFKHKSMNKHVLMNFQSEKWQNYYLEAFLRYLEELAKHNKHEPGGQAAIWAAQTAFRKASEYCRYEILAEVAHTKVKEGKNVIIGCIYTDTFNAVIAELKNKYKYTDDQIAQIKGGQSKQSRWDNVNRFQDEKALIAVVMQQAGGTALSLHHYKPRNKRPRFIVSGPVWSVIEQLQFLGRGHRINSASTTHQWIIWYAGTIEEEVYERLQKKALSLREMMKRKENWSELFVKESLRHKVDTTRKEHLDISTDEEDDEPDAWNTDAEILAENVEVEV